MASGNHLLYFRRSTRKKSKIEEKTNDDAIENKVEDIKEESDIENFENFEENFKQEDSHEEPPEAEAKKSKKEPKEPKRRIIKKRRKYNKSSGDTGGGGLLVDGKTYNCQYCDFSSKKLEWISHLKKVHADKNLVSFGLAHELKTTRCELLIFF